MYFKVSFYSNGTHRIYPSTKEDYEQRLKTGKPLVCFILLSPKSNLFDEIIVSIETTEEELAIGTAVFELIKYIEENIAREAGIKAKMNFYEEITGRIPLVNYVAGFKKDLL